MNAQQIKIDTIQKQFLCLKNPLVRITASTPKEIDGYPKNFCKNNDIEEFWTLEDVIKNLPLLSKFNLQGYNIFVTPIENSEYIYILIDDIRPTFYDAGFKPNLLIQSSPNSRQAVFVLPYKYPREHYLKAFNTLNKTYGDEFINGLRHGFRLLGFTNPKPKHQQPDGSFPFVRLVSRSQAICPAMTTWIDCFCAPLLSLPSQPLEKEKQELKTPPTPTKNKSIFSLWGRKPVKPVAKKYKKIVAGKSSLNTETAYARHADDVRKHDSSLTDTNVDYRIAQRLLITGHEPGAIANAISSLSQRQRSDNDSYATATVKNAGESLSGQENKKNIYLHIEQ